MKHAVLTSVGHNISDSLSCGMGFLIGTYGEIDVYGEAAIAPDRFMEVDFLTGETSGTNPSPSLDRAIRLYAKALPELCERQGVAVEDFRRLTARYSGTGRDCGFIVEVTDRNGRTSRDVYRGLSGARPKGLDPLGRVRRLKSPG